MRSLISTVALLMVYIITTVFSCNINNDDDGVSQLFYVNEETPVGSSVGLINFHDVTAIKHLSVESDNPYFAFQMQDDGQYEVVVRKRIDTDKGLTTIQSLRLNCVTTTRLSLEIELEFVLIDINDHTPEFQPHDHYNFQVSETASKGTQVGVLRAEDKDIKNSRIEYELIQPTPGSFSLIKFGNKDVRLVLSGSLNYERQSSFNLTVIAKDCHDRANCLLGQKTSSATISVVVKDEDDLDPNFEKASYTATIFDTTSLNDTILTVHAYDQDALSHDVVYDLEGEGSDYFSIDPETGDIRLRGQLPITTAQYILQANAVQKSNSDRMDTANIIIKVEATSQPPTIINKEIEVSENAAVNSILATDIFSPEMGSNTERKQSHIIMSGTDAAKFAIQEAANGKLNLVLEGSLDFEDRSDYNLEITAQTQRSAITINLHITVVDENDNDPEFTHNTYNFLFNVSSGSNFVGEVLANDADTIARDLTYYVADTVNEPRLFEVCRNGTILSLLENSALSEQSVFKLNVKAIDNGEPPRFSTCLVQIIVQGAALDKIVTSQSKYTEGPGYLMYIIVVICACLLITTVILVACFVKRRWTNTKLNEKHLSSTPTQTPTNTLLQPSSKLFNGSYKNMSELGHDTEFNTLWSDDSAMPLQSYHRDENNKEMVKKGVAANRADSDSGHSSCYSRHYSPTLARVQQCERAHSPRTKNDFVSVYINDQSSPADSECLTDRSYPVETLPAFNSRPASPVSVNSQLTVSYSTSYDTQIPACGLSPSPSSSVEDYVQTSSTSPRQPTDENAGTFIQIRPAARIEEVLNSPEPPQGSFTTFQTDF